jgi:hypothetical protein
VACTSFSRILNCSSACRISCAEPVALPNNGDRTSSRFTCRTHRTKSKSGVRSASISPAGRPPTPVSRSLSSMRSPLGPRGARRSDGPSAVAGPATAVSPRPTRFADCGPGRWVSPSRRRDEMASQEPGTTPDRPTPEEPMPAEPGTMPEQEPETAPEPPTMPEDPDVESPSRPE